jgi:electron transport complex protein RnfG
MPEMVKLTLILLVVCLFSAAALSQTYNGTKDKIAENRKATESIARLAVLPGATAVAEFDLSTTVEASEKNEPSLLVFSGVDSSDKQIGWAFKVSEKGFSGDIDVMVGCRKNEKGLLTVTGTRVLRHSETPGLGAEMNTLAYSDVQKLGDKAVPKFQKQFIGKSVKQLSLKALDPANGTIDSMTAATISSKAFTKAVREGIEKFQAKLEEVSK